MTTNERIAAILVEIASMIRKSPEPILENFVQLDSADALRAVGEAIDSCDPWELERAEKIIRQARES